MTPVTRTDGNVIHADFGQPLPTGSFTCETLYQDEHAMLLRIVYHIGGKRYLQHIASGVGLDA